MLLFGIWTADVPIYFLNVLLVISDLLGRMLPTFNLKQYGRCLRLRQIEVLR